MIHEINGTHRLHILLPVDKHLTNVIENLVDGLSC